MHGPVKDESSAVFSATFIKGLAYGLTIQEAFDHACTQMGMVDIEIKSIPRLYVRRDADAGSLRVIEQPRILARFILDKNNKPVIDHAYDEDNMFQMEIFIRHAPASISVVLFQYIDTKWSLEQQVAEVGHDCREFKDTLEENGDIEIRATLWNPQGGMAIKSSLL